jgi:hypothetical protein
MKTLETIFTLQASTLLRRTLSPRQAVCTHTRPWQAVKQMRFSSMLGFVNRIEDRWLAIPHQKVPAIVEIPIGAPTWLASLDLKQSIRRGKLTGRRAAPYAVVVVMAPLRRVFLIPVQKDRNGLVY